MDALPPRGPGSEPIAITGLAFKMPQDAINEMGLWHILEKGINVKTRWPAARTTTDVFYDDGSNKPNMVINSMFKVPFILHRSHRFANQASVFATATAS